MSSGMFKPRATEKGEGMTIQTPIMKPHDVSCPTCGAKPGMWCTSNGTYRRRGTHRSRVKASHVKPAKVPL